MPAIVVGFPIIATEVLLVASFTTERSPVALRVPLHDADAVPDHDPGGGLLCNRSRERGAAQIERALARESGTHGLCLGVQLRGLGL
jgi:hypothetical protein